MANQVVKVKRETIAACMTCPICNKLLRDATTISECLHTFCRKCIYQKIEDEGLDCCPICNIDLGCVPLEKLRPDHNLQDVRAKIFPFKRRKVEAPDLPPSVTLPVRIKERSLSSLVVTTPKVSTQTPTGRRTKPVPRKVSSLRGPSFSVEKHIKKDQDHAEDYSESLSSPETLNRFNQSMRQNSSSAEGSQPSPNDEAENGKSDLWQPLNCLVEVANRTKSFKANSQAFNMKLESTSVIGNEPQLRNAKIKENMSKSKVQDENNKANSASSDQVGSKRLRRIQRRKAAAFRNSALSSQAVLDAAGAMQERRFCPVWFTLVASEDQGGDAPLPQIPASYIRIKDGNMPVSSIQKYLMKKLDLASESEVEIKCMGQPVLHSFLLCNLVDLWLQTASTSERMSVSIGSSAKDYVMVLAYARKVPGPE